MPIWKDVEMWRNVKTDWENMWKTLHRGTVHLLHVQDSVPILAAPRFTKIHQDAPTASLALSPHLSKSPSEVPEHSAEHSADSASD